MIYIKYSGNIQDRNLIPPLEDELIEIAQISNWQYERIIENFNTLTSASKRERQSSLFYGDIDDDEDSLILNSSDVFLEGIALFIDKYSEPLRITFDKSGKLAMISFCTTDTAGLNKKLVVKKYEFLYYPYIKIYTNNADKHIRIIKMLEYLKKRYIKDLEVIDTSFYWNNHDEEDLRVKMWKMVKDKKITL
ncbi:MAG: hypothetical protein KA120_05615 [Candidatus Goldbacteria bacterium]|nr:hypothetical protein [Candidatus Goldiibacteriota bacterium]HPD18659.1 hypothetical protein [Candidatus Goldiibacteriota bacterium]